MKTVGCAGGVGLTAVRYDSGVAAAVDTKVTPSEADIRAGYDLLKGKTPLMEEAFAEKIWLNESSEIERRNVTNEEAYLPWPPLGVEVEVTDDMRRVGFLAGNTIQPRSPLMVETLDAIYRAMRALEPTTEITVVTQDASAQRNIAWEEIRCLETAVAALTEAKAAYIERVEALVTENGRLLQLLFAKELRITELDSELARRPALHMERSVEHSPFRVPPRDPRRMGP